MICEYCKQEFKITEQVMDAEFGLVHAYECFEEYCYDIYGGRSQSYMDYKMMIEQNEKRMRKYNNDLSMKSE